MAGSVDKEIDAIGQIMRALEPLDSKARISVIEYVSKRLDIATQVVSIPPSALFQVSPGASSAPLTTSAAGPIHIRELKDRKQPRSANEMAALVAYYLSEVVSPSERKATVNTEDIVQQFKIAKFSLPRIPKMTLANAKNAGYFDLAGNGEYRLNPVGYNLVEHGMPRGGGADGKSSAKRRGRARAKR